MPELTENPVYGRHDEQTLQQFHDVLSRAYRGALMADGHLGFVMPIGGVIAYENKLSPVGVGFDIGCGNMAVKLNVKREDVDVSSILDLIEKEIEFGLNKVNKKAPADDPIFEAEEWDAYPSEVDIEKLKKKARKQFGTVGSGNHYVDVLVDEEDYIWLGNHFGSRRLGFETAGGFMNLSQNKDWYGKTKQVEGLLDLDRPVGEAYYAAMNLAGRYAWRSREWVLHHLVTELGAEILDTVHNNHNFAWIEQHEGRNLVVIRKGATPAFPGQHGFVGGSMGDISVIVEGVDSQESRQSLYSTIHGAGRIMSRTKAKGNRKKKGVVTSKMLHDRLQKKGVELRGGGLDEAPQVYRRLEEVLSEQGDTIKVQHRLRPLGVVMDGSERYVPGSK